MSQETVLLVEDSDDIRTFITDAVLRPDGYHILIAKDGQLGLECALSTEPDLILLDLHLPRLPGLTLLSRLRQQDYNIPTIVLSAHGSEKSILEAFRLGAKDFLQKPFTVDQVKGAIKNALTEERLRREKENLTQAVALANQRLQRQIHNWTALNEIALTLTSTLKESEVFRRVIESVNRILQVEAGSLLLIDRETGLLEFAATTQGSADQLSDIHLAPGQGIAGWVAQHGEPLIVSDARQDTRFFAEMDDITGFESRAILCVPLRTKDRTIGVLEVINKLSGPNSPSFTQGDSELLTALARWVTVAVENAQLNRATALMAATTALEQAVVAVAHHVNNRLMTLSLILDRLELEHLVEREGGKDLIRSAQQCIQEISGVIDALDRLEEIRTVPYTEDTEMIDIYKSLRK